MALAFYLLVGITNASFYDSQIRSSNQSSLEPTYDKTQVDIRLFNILYCTSKRKTPPQGNNNPPPLQQQPPSPPFLLWGWGGGRPRSQSSILLCKLSLPSKQQPSPPPVPTITSPTPTLSNRSRAIRFSGLGVRSVGPLGDFFDFWHRDFKLCPRGRCGKHHLTMHIDSGHSDLTQAHLRFWEMGPRHFSGKFG